ncbi:MAG: sensor domain-containing diguanylate cyclase [Methylobacterium sp.]|nr:sensor domain-containing diguanylate cyclase [Methylobacterium sp.]
MHAHIPTIFLVIIALSFSLAGAIAAVSFGRSQGLASWVAGISLNGVGYLLFSLQGAISDLFSIVVANLAISVMFVLFAEGLRNFTEPGPPRWIDWIPPCVIAIGLSLFLNDLHARTLLTGLVFMVQSLILTYFAYRLGERGKGRGQYVIVAGTLLFSLIMLLRLIGSLSGQFIPESLTSADPVQTLIYLISMVSALLVMIGILLMTWERDEQMVKDSEIRMRALFEGTSDAVMLFDDHGLLDCNAATLKLFGCPAKHTFLSGPSAGLSPPRQPCGSDSESLSRQHIAIARRDLSNRFEWLFHRLDDGTPFHAEVLLNSMTIQGRNVLQAVVRDITERKHLLKDLERQAHLDYLTGLHNRGYFMHLAEIEVARAVRYSSHLSLMMMDVDNFKKVNDTHGHKAGDLVLKKFAEICHDTLREVDIIGRIGGEEFAVLLPETDIDEAMEVAQRLRQKIASTKVGIDHGLPLRFTISIGVSALSPNRENLDVLLSFADKALYLAKESGKNRVARNAED